MEDESRDLCVASLAATWTEPRMRERTELHSGTGPFCKASDRSGRLILHHPILVQVYDSPSWFVSIHFHIATATFICCVFLPM